VAALAGWMKEGKLKSKEDVVQGLEHFPQALNMLFEGRTSASWCCRPQRHEPSVRLSKLHWNFNLAALTTQSSKPACLPPTTDGGLYGK
jgi:hypothetical protein